MYVAGNSYKISFSPRLPTWAAVLVSIVLMSCSGRHSDSTPIAVEPGVSLALAQQRVAQISDVSYELELLIPAVLTDPVNGQIAIEFTLDDTVDSLVLDFRAPADHVHTVTLQGELAEFYLPADHIVVATPGLTPGRHRLTVSFTSTDAALNRQPEFMYSLFVPDRASTAFPLFDQPDIKARYQLTLTVPTHWQVLSNGDVVSRMPAPGQDAFERWEFAQTLPISSYLFAFAAGELQVVTEQRSGREYRLFHRETDAVALQRNQSVIFDLHAEAMEWLESYTGIDYPFGKFDFFAIPAFQFGGMEHPGAIWYRAESLFLDPGATRNQELGRASLIAHETAHMWFGDLVTMRWFNDVWMKEVFANFMAAKIAGPAFPDLDLQLRFFQAHHPLAYDVDRTPGANPIRQPLDNLRDAGSLYGAIIYQKAPIVMQQLETLLGEEVLRTGLRRYLQDYSFANADWEELISILDALTAQDLSIWSHAWVNEPGRPRITAESGENHLIVTQSDDNAARQLLWQQPLSLLIRIDGSWQERSVVLDGEPAILPVAGEISAVLAGADGVSYARFELDETSLANLPDLVATMPVSLHRAVAWQTLWEEVLDGRLSGSILLDALLESLATEADMLVAQQMLNHFRQLWWRYLDETERQSRADSLEATLWARLEGATSAGEKGSWFGAIVSLSESQQGLDRLYRIWAQELVIDGLPLQEQQFILLAETLAVRQFADVDQMLQAQLERIINPDRRARFEFIRPALSPDPAVRHQKFFSFAALENRRQESWVLDAARLIHHPLRSAEATGLIRPGLDMLESIKQTGDIFFPLRWLHAMLDGHYSLAAAQSVQDFLDQRSDLEFRLRDKVMQAADGLNRAAR